MVAIFKDEGISGTKGRDRRPGLDALLKGVARREFDIVAACSVCRLGRSLSDLIGLPNELRSREIDLYLHQQALDTSTQSGRMLFGMLGVFSEFERAMIRDRVLAGLDRARSSGKRLGGHGRPICRDELHDTKTGSSLRPWSELACSVIQSQPRIGDVVFPSSSGETPIIGYRKMWLRTAKLVDFPADITPHVLRHSFSSLAADLGYSEPTIASLLGHKMHSVTSRYMHSADAVLLAAADAVANATMKLMTSDQAQPQLRDQQRDGSVVRDELTSL